MSESNKVAIERQKLIHSGKVLENELKISETALKEGDFVVLMTVTPKPVTQQQQQQQQPKEQSKSTSENPSTLSTSQTPTATGTSNFVESKLVTGEDYEDAIKRLVDMGFPKDQVVAAMKASFNNPERAVEYLTTGNIPFGETDEQPSSGDNSGSLDFLRNDPQFQQLKLLIQQNPQMLGPLIEQLGQNSPELLQLIENNREEFYSLIMDGEEGDLADEDDETNLPEGAEVLQITEAEKQAIERLEAMGFDRRRVIEAFFACDKNEELAANFLLENADQD